MGDEEIETATTGTALRMRTVEGHGGWNGEGADCEVTERLWLSQCMWPAVALLGLFFTEMKHRTPTNPINPQHISYSYKSSQRNCNFFSTHSFIY